MKKAIDSKAEETAPEVAAEVVATEETLDYGTVIKPFNELVTTVQPTAETAEETEEE